MIQGTALGVYEGGLVPVAAGRTLYRFRAGRIVVATGSVEQPLVFPGNDLAGVMLPSAVARLVDEWALRPGERAVVVSADDRGLEAVDACARAGTEVARVVDLRAAPIARLSADGRRGRLRAVTIDGRGCWSATCSSCLAAHSRRTRSPGAGRGAVEYDVGRGVFVPRELPAGVEAVGTVADPAARGTAPDPAYAGQGEVLRLHVRGRDDEGPRHALDEGFDSIELAKRYTTVTMGPCQGKLCQLRVGPVFAAEQAIGEEAIGATTARPPWQPTPLGCLRRPPP